MEVSENWGGLWGLSQSGWMCVSSQPRPSDTTQVLEPTMVHGFSQTLRIRHPPTTCSAPA